jgi:hypothetical protein
MKADLSPVGPLEADLFGPPCAACRRRMIAGEYVTLIELGPGIDPEERARCRGGSVYNAVAIPVHWACATGEEGPP